MKKFLAIITMCIICTFTLAGCGMNQNITSEKWINVNDCDTYTFNKDGSGNHDKAEINFTVENNVISVTEGAGANAPIKFTLDESGDVVKLTSDNINGYYVHESDYEALAKKIRKENEKILTSNEFWKLVGNQVSYIQFLEGGKGWCLTQYSGYGVGGTGTFVVDWEMYDNDTVKFSINVEDVDSTSYHTYNIVNNNGSYQLTDDQGQVIMVPKQ